MPQLQVVMEAAWRDGPLLLVEQAGNPLRSGSQVRQELLQPDCRFTDEYL